MTGEDGNRELDDVLAQFLRPVRNVPFPVVVKALAGRSVLPVDPDDPRDRQLIDAVRRAAGRCAELVAANPIVRNRPNEVGNDIEPFVIRAAVECGLRAERPASSSGVSRTTGYPDILMHDEHDRPTYLECKIYGEEAGLTTMRSFYLSPSDQFKVCLDARHLLLAFAVSRRSIGGTVNSEYRPTAFKLVDLHGLLCDVKYEFNSDNRRLYAPAMILAESRF